MLPKRGTQESLTYEMDIRLLKASERDGCYEQTLPRALLLIMLIEPSFF